jgi:RNA polymerase sigma-70 factor (ECF subfamily)
MRRYNQRLYRVVRSYLTDPADVQDAMQDAYLKAYEKLDQFRGGAAFSTWLIRIGINEALQRLKRKRTLHRHLDPDLRTDDLQHIPDTHMADPEEQIDRNENKAMLERAIDSLPETYRVVYMLREVEEASVTEVAAALGITESNVKVRSHRAKALLKEALFEQHTGREAFTFGNAHCDMLVAAVLARI